MTVCLRLNFYLITRVCIFSGGRRVEVRLPYDPVPGGGREHGLLDGPREEADPGHDPGAGCSGLQSRV